MFRVLKLFHCFGLQLFSESICHSNVSAYTEAVHTYDGRIIIVQCIRRIWKSIKIRSKPRKPEVPRNRGRDTVTTPSLRSRCDTLPCQLKNYQHIGTESWVYFQGLIQPKQRIFTKFFRKVWLFMDGHGVTDC